MQAHNALQINYGRCQFSIFNLFFGFEFSSRVQLNIYMFIKATTSVLMPSSEKSFEAAYNLQTKINRLLNECRGFLQHGGTDHEKENLLKTYENIRNRHVRPEHKSIFLIESLTELDEIIKQIEEQELMSRAIDLKALFDDQYRSLKKIGLGKTPDEEKKARKYMKQLQDKYDNIIDEYKELSKDTTKQNATKLQMSLNQSAMQLNDSYQRNFNFFKRVPNPNPNPNPSSKPKGGLRDKAKLVGKKVRSVGKSLTKLFTR